MISESSEQGKYGRWQFDADDLFIQSSGGKSKVPMGFEFFIPADQEPLALYVKNLRVPVSNLEEPREFAKASDRSKLVQTGSLLTGHRVKRSFDLSNAVESSENPNAKFGNSIGTVVSSQIVKQRGLNLNEDNEITGGNATFDTKLETGRKNAPTGKKLRVEKLWYGSSQSMLTVSVGSGIEGGLLSEAANQASGDAPFIVVDENDNEYEAVGYIFEDAATNLLEIRYTPGDTLSGLNESGFPRISRSKDGQKLNLIFLVSRNVEIKYFAIGDTVLVHYDPPLTGR